MNIAIDGPAGSGKSTIARMLAKQIGFLYVDTGAMYRAMALFCIRNGMDVKNEELVSSRVEEMQVSIAYENDVQQVYLNNENVSEYIRSPQVSAATSTIAAYRAVRQKLLSLQREIASNHDVIMDGRDIGTHILPQAECKIYLTASVETRARRRYQELLEKGEDVEMDDICEDIRKRDERDMNREIAPLRQAEDAVLLDSSDLTIDQVLDRMKEILESKRKTL